jgi:mono/diheme cytochrome c family protein
VRIRIAGFLVFVLVATLFTWSSLSAEENGGAVERGRFLVEGLCARCHATGAQGDSPFDEAPPFRVIAGRYEIEALAEAFAEGIVVGHPAMPVFEFSPDLIGDLLAYLGTLEPAEN